MAFHTKPCLFCFVLIVVQRPGKQFFSHVETEPPIPGYYQYLWGVNTKPWHSVIQKGFILNLVHQYVACHSVLITLLQNDMTISCMFYFDVYLYI